MSFNWLGSQADTTKTVVLKPMITARLGRPAMRYLLTLLMLALFSEPAAVAQENSQKTILKKGDGAKDETNQALRILQQKKPEYLKLIAPLTDLTAPATSFDGPRATPLSPVKPLVKNATDKGMGPRIALKPSRKTASEESAASENSENAIEDTESSIDLAPAPLTLVEPEPLLDYLGTPMNVAELGELRDQIRRTLIYYYKRPEAVNSRSPWGVMHSLIGYGVDTNLQAGREQVNAIGWLCWNGNCRGQRLLRLSNGNLAVNVGPGVQGHTGQFLSMLAQSYVPSEFEIRIQGKSFTVDDLIAYEQATCRPRTELTFKLIGLSHYLPSDAEWVSNDGQKWSIARLIEEEIAQPVVGAACGGTHRLMGLTYAVKNRVDEGKPLDGEWKRAERFLEDFQKYTIGLQNPDGSFSTKWFERREARTDSQRRVQTTGHILEWLTCNLPEEHLTSPEIVKAAAYLSNLMYRERGNDWKIGPKGHAIHALNLYDQKVFNARVGMGGPRMDWNSVESLQR